MTNLPVPTPYSASTGNFLTSALWNATVRDGINFLTNVPIFYGYQTVSQSLTAAQYTPVLLDSETLDSYGGHSTSTNTSRYTCQLAGVYEVCANAAVAANSGGLMAAYVAKNGAEVTGSRMATNPMTGHNTGAATGTVQIQLAVGDYVELYIYNQTAVGTATGPWCSMAVNFIHA